MTTDSAPSGPKLGVPMTLLVLVGTVVFMSAFMATYKALGVGMPYVGLFFLLYWAAMLHQDFKQFLPTVFGGLVGTGLAWLLMAMPHLQGQAGSLGAYGALGVVLFCYISGRALLFVNHGTMLFVLLAIIPEARVENNVVVMMKSLVLAAGFMGVVAVALRQVQKLRAKRG